MGTVGSPASSRPSARGRRAGVAELGLDATTERPARHRLPVLEQQDERAVGLRELRRRVVLQLGADLVDGQDALVPGGVLVRQLVQQRAHQRVGEVGPADRQGGGRRGHDARPRGSRSPAVTANGRWLPSTGAGHVPKSLNAYGRLTVRLRSIRSVPAARSAPSTLTSAPRRQVVGLVAEQDGDRARGVPAGQPQGVPHTVALDVDLAHEPHVVHEPVLRRTDRHLDGLVVPAHRDVEHPRRVVRVASGRRRSRCAPRRAGRAPAGRGGRCGGPARRPRGPRRRVPPARTPPRASTAPPRPSAASVPTSASRVCGSVTPSAASVADQRVVAVGPPQPGHARDRPRRRGQRVQPDQG